VEAERADPFRMLERGGEDRRAAAISKPRLEQLLDMGDARADHYSLNKSLRRAHRTQRKEAAAQLEEGRAMGLPDHIRLLPSTAADAAAAEAAFDDARLRSARSASTSSASAAASGTAASSCPFEAMRKVRGAGGALHDAHRWR
jgi:hypothetical protein